MEIRSRGDRRETADSSQKMESEHSPEIGKSQQETRLPDSVFVALIRSPFAGAGVNVASKLRTPNYDL
jgi:hypothetical protein